MKHAVFKFVESYKQRWFDCVDSLKQARNSIQQNDACVHGCCTAKCDVRVCFVCAFNEWHFISFHFHESLWANSVWNTFKWKTSRAISSQLMAICHVWTGALSFVVEARALWQTRSRESAFSFIFNVAFKHIYQFMLRGYPVIRCKSSLCSLGDWRYVSTSYLGQDCSSDFNYAMTEPWQ